MDYEEKYNEALQRAKSIYRDAKSEHCTHTDWLENIFPELKESDDEKIRNFLIDFIKVCVWSEKQYPPQEDCVAWLEKQKPVELSKEDKENFAWFDKFFRAESIIANGRDIPQDKYQWFKSLKPQNPWKPSEEQMYSLEYAIRTTIGESINNGLVSLCNDLNKTFKPKTSIEICPHSIKGKSYLETGYSVEQNHAWSEEDKDNLYHINALINNSSLEVRRQEYLSGWLESLKERVQPQPQQEWSEEDAKMLNKCIEYASNIVPVKPTKESGLFVDFKRIPDEKAQDWLKSLKDRIRPQPKSDWNNNDEISFNRLMAICADERVRRNSVFSEKEIKDLMDWLESIKKRAQPQWKPSDEQMTTLDRACKELGFDESILESLYNDLKALCER